MDMFFVGISLWFQLALAGTAIGAGIWCMFEFLNWIRLRIMREVWRKRYGEGEEECTASTSESCEKSL